MNMNVENIIREIIKTLHGASGHPLLEDVLKLQVDCRVRPRPTALEFGECLKQLQAKGFVMSRPNEMEESNPYWHLDEKGEVFAAKNLRL